jgi:peptidoglycan/xylan/chitin deacetylase (PgdA/CDA1 family)
MDALSDEWLRRDVLRAEETIRQITGIDPKPWFRCPFGSGIDDSRVLEALEELGYRHVGWDVDPEDWDEDRTVDELVEPAAGEGIVLLHAWPAVTADGLMHLIDALRQREAEFVGWTSSIRRRRPSPAVRACRSTGPASPGTAGGSPRPRRTSARARPA